jgi:uncharacterized protein
MGSVHVLRPEVYPLDDALYEAFDAAEIAAFELDFGEMMVAATLMMQRGIYADGRTLRELTAEMYAELDRRTGEYGVAMAMVERMKPWMAALTLSPLVMQHAGLEAAAEIDLHVYERAKAAGRTIIGFETMADQIAVFEGLDEAGQVVFRRSALEQLDTTVGRLDEATEYWRRGDAGRLAEMFTESIGDKPGGSNMLEDLQAYNVAGQGFQGARDRC